SGLFLDATAQLPLGSFDTRDVALGDVDGDGDADAIVANSGEASRLWLNAGAFSDATGLLPAGVHETRAAALADFDGDGDLDLLLGIAGEATRLFLNGGSGAFADASGLFPAHAFEVEDVATGDLDGDGDVDAVVADLRHVLVHSNLARQVARTGVPRIGKPLALDLWGPPLGAWGLGVAAAPGFIPSPPYGIFRLDPLSFVFLASGSLDAQGRAAVSFDVPPAPALVGLSVYWQGIAGPPLRLTNLEVTTLTDL
ncbi:MAG: FG-GAP-like repeat-containing protein, partial [Planctomycetota bacterium]